jgi:3-phosphoshikimate 1-carboxyvinyltransferase
MPHIEMTIDCLQKRGVVASQTGEASWRVEPGEISGGARTIEPDLSNAGPFLAAAMVAGGSVRISNWPKSTTQVGDDFDGILQQMGATIVRDGNDLVISGSGEIQGIDIDLSSGGELTPVIAALAALASSPTQIRGVGHLRGHETDRLSALMNEINSIGGNATETPDGLIIKPANLRGGLWRTYEDHRMATAGAIIGLRIPGIEIEDVSVTNKTIPAFVKLWTNMIGTKA